MNLFYEDVYSQHLTTINGIKFTRREIDVIACVLNARGTKKIAAVLSMALRTVTTHLQNIMRKIGCNSREGIIDFLEKSSEIVFLRTYYAGLLAEKSFQRSLKEIASLEVEATPSSLAVYCEDLALKQALCCHLSSHLENLGIRSTIQEEKTSHKKKEPTGLQILFLEKKEGVIDLSGSQDYYEAVFNILKKLYPSPPLEGIIRRFYNKEGVPVTAPPLLTHKKIAVVGVLGLLVCVGMVFAFIKMNAGRPSGLSSLVHTPRTSKDDRN